MCTATQTQVDEFGRLQLAIDAMLRLGPDDLRDGPTGPEDKYLEFGREWWRYIATGMSFFASAPTRAALARTTSTPA